MRIKGKGEAQEGKEKTQKRYGFERIAATRCDTRQEAMIAATANHRGCHCHVLESFNILFRAEGCLALCVGSRVECTRGFVCSEKIHLRPWPPLSSALPPSTPNPPQVFKLRTRQVRALPPKCGSATSADVLEILIKKKREKERTTELVTKIRLACRE